LVHTEKKGGTLPLKFANLGLKYWGQVRAKTTADYLVIGSSHAAHLSKLLTEQGYTTRLVSILNWRIYKGSASQLVKLAIEAIEIQEPKTIIMQLLDNSCYFARCWDGSRLPPTKTMDGGYHMLGEVMLCTRDTQLEHFKALKPLFDLVGKRKGLLITPMPRYLVRGCCADPEHATNVKDPQYKNKMMADFEEMRGNFKKFLFHDGYRNMKMLDPNVDLRGLAEDEVWGEDPVHPLAAAYKKIAARVIKITNSMSKEASSGQTEAKRRREDSNEVEGAPQHLARRGRVEPPSASERGRGEWRSS
jgi:hypothetical protein